MYILYPGVNDCFSNHLPSNWIIAVKTTFYSVKPSTNHQYQVIGSVKSNRPTV